MQAIPEQTISAIERHLHDLIQSRAGRLIEKHPVPLPSLAAMLAGEPTGQRGQAGSFHPSPGPREPDAWFFDVPGMFGGFRLRWIAGGPEAKLESVSFCRVAGGSGQRHEITIEGSVLMESDMF